MNQIQTFIAVEFIVRMTWYKNDQHKYNQLQKCGKSSRPSTVE